MRLTQDTKTPEGLVARLSNSGIVTLLRTNPKSRGIGSIFHKSSPHQERILMQLKINNMHGNVLQLQA